MPKSTRNEKQSKRQQIDRMSVHYDKLTGKGKSDKPRVAG